MYCLYNWLLLAWIVAPLRLLDPILIFTKPLEYLWLYFLDVPFFFMTYCGKWSWDWSLVLLAYPALTSSFFCINCFPKFTIFIFVVFILHNVQDVTTHARTLCFFEKILFLLSNDFLKNTPYPYSFGHCWRKYFT